MEFKEEEVIGDYPNKTVRKFLAKEWHKLNPIEQLKLRAIRSKRGIACDICGRIGYFRENCPASCTSPPSTPDSLDSTPPSSPKRKKKEDIVGNTSTGSGFKAHDITSNSAKNVTMFWGHSTSSPLDEEDALSIGTASLDKSHSQEMVLSLNPITPENNKKKSSYEYRRPVNMKIVRPQATRHLKDLRKSDKSIGEFNFFHYAEETYHRDYSELTLHQLMRKLMRLLENHLLNTSKLLEASFDTTLLVPPVQR